MKKKRKICIVTGSRADYGHLKNLIYQVKKDKDLELQLVATGMHLSSKFGMTYKNIENDGFKVNHKVAILNFGDSTQGVTQSIGLGCQKLAKIYKQLKPDMVVVLGDRFEILAATIAAYIAKIIIVHIHGGEVTQGVIDEGFRHSITKMATFHFVAIQAYKKRVIQLGENPKRVFCYGAPGLDNVYHLKMLSKSELAKDLGFPLNGRVAIATYHPVTLEKEGPNQQIHALLRALMKFPLQVIFTKANADTHGSSINKLLNEFTKKYPERFKLVDNLGEQRYYSCLKHFDFMVGNSSSGIIEASSFAIPVVNIGDRQKWRIKAKNVIDTGYSYSAIEKGIRKAFSKKFKNRLKTIKNPYDLYGDGKTCYRIKEKLKQININDDLIKKTFFDIHFKSPNFIKKGSGSYDH